MQRNVANTRCLASNTVSVSNRTISCTRYSVSLPVGVCVFCAYVCICSVPPARDSVSVHMPSYLAHGGCQTMNNESIQRARVGEREREREKVMEKEKGKEKDREDQGEVPHLQSITIAPNLGQREKRRLVRRSLPASLSSFLGPYGAPSPRRRLQIFLSSFLFSQRCLSPSVFRRWASAGLGFRRHYSRTEFPHLPSGMYAIFVRVSLAPATPSRSPVWLLRIQVDTPPLCVMRHVFKPDTQRSLV